jgi:hypothetical protein
VAVSDFELDQTAGDRPAGLDEERWFHPNLLMLMPKSIEFRFEYGNSSIGQKFQFARSRYRTACLVRRKRTALQILSAAAVGRLDAVIFDTLQQYRTKS